MCYVNSVMFPTTVLTLQGSNACKISWQCSASFYSSRWLARGTLGCPGVWVLLQQMVGRGQAGLSRCVGFTPADGWQGASWAAPVCGFYSSRWLARGKLGCPGVWVLLQQMVGRGQAGLCRCVGFTPADGWQGARWAAPVCGFYSSRWLTRGTLGCPGVWVLLQQMVDKGHAGLPRCVGFTPADGWQGASWAAPVCGFYSSRWLARGTLGCPGVWVLLQQMVGKGQAGLPQCVGFSPADGWQGASWAAPVCGVYSSRWLANGKLGCPSVWVLLQQMVGKGQAGLPHCVGFTPADG